VDLAPFNERQSKHFVDTVQLFEAFSNAQIQMQHYVGSMQWKNAKGKQYLFHAKGGRGSGNSLGPRTKDTEQIYSEFSDAKIAAKTTFKELQSRIKEQAATNRAVKLGRVPNVVTAILRQMDIEGVLGRNIEVVGTNAMYVYEFMSAARFDSDLLATGDMDILWNAQSQLRLKAEMKQKGMLGLLQSVDKSFKTVFSTNSFRAVNDDGYYVDLIKPTANPPWNREPDKLTEGDELVAAEIDSQRWMVSSPRVSEVVIGNDGYPAKMIAPDPRAFALHKLWLSQQSDRDPVKKIRDRSQSFAVVEMVERYLPQYKFNEQQLRMFPKEVRDTFKHQMPPGFSFE